MSLKKYIAGILPVALLLTGCSQPPKVQTTSPLSTFETPIPSVCSVDSDCILTTKLYHPCGTVFAINKNTQESEIAEYNSRMEKEFSGKQFDCSLPPKEKDFRALCVQQKCVTAKL